MMYSFFANARKCAFLLCMIVLTAVSAGFSETSVPVVPFSFGNTATDSANWAQLMKYKLWATGESGKDAIVLYDDVHITDTVGYIGSAYGNMLLKNNNHALGGPILFGGDFNNETGGDSILTGPTRFKAFNVASNGMANNYFRGLNCAQSVSDNYYSAKEASRANRTCNGVPAVDVNLKVPSVDTNFSFNAKLGSLSTDNIDMFIDVPSGNTVYDILIDNLSVSNHGDIYVRMPPDGRPTRIVVKNNFKIVNNTSVYVIYAENVDQWQNGKWNVPIEKKASNADYRGDLLFYVNNMNIPAGKKNMQGTYITNGHIQIAQEESFAGQLIANSITIEAKFHADQFRFVPFNPSVVSSSALAQGMLYEGKGLTALKVELNTPSSTPVSIKYCITFAADAASYENQRKSGKTGTVVTPATSSDLDLNGQPVCRADGSVSEMAEFKDQGIELKTPIKMAAHDDTIPENREYFIFRVLDVAGGVLENGTRSGDFKIYIEDNDDEVSGKDTVIVPEVRVVGDKSDSIGYEDVQFKIESFPANYRSSGEGKVSYTKMTTYKVQIETVPAKGSFLFNGKAVKAGDVISSDDLAKGYLTYQGAKDEFGDASATPAYKYTSFTYKIVDPYGETSKDAFTMTIALSPVNDKPQFDRSNMIYDARVFFVDENSAVGTAVGTVIATDVDQKTDAAATLRFSLETIDGTKDVFVVDAETGDIAVNKAVLNYEREKYYVLRLIVVDNGIATDRVNVLRDTLKVVVNVNDKNDPPDVDPKISAIDVREHAPKDSVLIGYKGHDEDEGQLLYFTMESADAAIATSKLPFELIAIPANDSAYLKVKSDIDFETMSNKYVVRVIVADNSDRSKAAFDTTTLTVTILDMNEAPYFDKATYAYEINEKYTGGQSVGTLAAKDYDVKATPATAFTYTLGKVYDVTDKSNKVEVTDLFVIDASTGEISVSSSISGTLGASRAKHTYEAEVTATDNGSSQSFKVNKEDLSGKVNVSIYVKNVNDPPSFDSTKYEFKVAENSAVGTLLGNVKAEDDDEEDVLTFGLDADASLPFKIVSVGPNEIKLVVKNAVLDYETKSKYEFKVTVSDGIETVKAPVTVLIEDVNEDPYFPVASYSFKINEKYKGGDAVGSLSAGDYDTKATPATVLTYELGDVYDVTDPNNTMKVTDLFVINSSTGEISVSSSFTEQLGAAYVGHSYEMNVTATDNGASQNFAYNKKDLSTSVPVYVVINEINNPPHLDQDSYVFTIAEHSFVDGKFVGKIEAIDADTFDKLSFSTDPSNLSPFKIVKVSDRVINVVLAKDELNFETKSSYSFKVKVSDGLASAEGDVTIKVLDVNETPYFAKSSYKFKITEKYKGSEAVGSVSAADYDTKATPATVLSYTLGKVYDVTDKNNKVEVKDLFEIDVATGEIAVSSSLGSSDLGNSYAGHSFETEVTVTDNGANQNFAENKKNLSAKVNVSIVVSNVNDPPAFDSLEYNFSIAENSPANTVVGLVVARDDDAGDKLAFSMALLDGASVPFKIVASGDSAVEVVLKEDVLDFETKDIYTFKVKVTDDSSASAEVKVIVHVLDVNEKPSIVRTELFIDEDAAVGDIAGFVDVVDVDTWTKLSYTLLDSTVGAAQLFKIKPSTACDPGVFCAEISLASATLNFEKDSVYFLKVVATDNGATAGFPPSLSDTAVVKVHVNDKNDKPHFLVHSGTAEVDENSADGVFVGQFVAVDEDNHYVPQDILEYSLIEVSANSTKYFQINSSTGEITVAMDDVLDYESVAEYKVKVRVTDNNGDDSADTLELTITIKDVNESPTLAQQFFDIDERASKNTVVNGGVVVAGDLDTAKAFMKHKFYAIDGDTAYFSIDSLTGQIRAKTKLPEYSSATESFELKVRVLDYSVSGKVLFVDEVMVITMNDINDPPTIVTDTLYVTENSPTGTFVGSIEATDDEDYPSQLFYELTASSKEFEMTTGGVVSVKKGANLDYETKTSYTIQVKVTDRKDASTSKKIVVMVVNENEAPVMNDTLFTVMENAPASTVVGKLVATDEEDPSYNLVFGLIGTSDEFEVLSTGRIIVKKGAKLDYETKKKYELDVYVMDKDSMMTTATVTINVGNVNEAPVIEKEDFHVAENSPAKTFVGSLTAHDAEDPDSLLTFTLVGSSKEFDVSKDGKITVKKGAVLDYETTKSYTLKVAVMDSENASSTASIRIIIDDIREIPTMDDTTLVIREDAKKGTFATLVVNNPENDSVKIRLVGKSSVFKVSEDGKVSLIDTLDYESVKEYELVVTVEGEDGSLDTAHVKIKVENVIEIPEVEITRGSTEDSVWLKPDTIYTNAKEINFEWTANKKMQPDTLVKFKTNGKHDVVICYEDPTMDKPGCDTVVVFVDNSIPTVSIRKTAEDTAAITGVTIVEQVDEKDTNFYVNHEMNEVRIHIKDTVAGVDSSFNIDLRLDSLQYIKNSLSDIKKVSKKENITLDDAESATTTKTLINDKKVEVSFTKKVDGIPVKVSYYTDKKGNPIKNDDGDVVMTVSYDTFVNGRDVTVSYKVNGKTGELIKDENGGAYEYSYEFEDKFGGLVGVSYKVDDKGELIKNEEGNYGYQVSYTYKNIYGNTATKNIFVVVDKVVPVVKIITPEHKKLVHTRGITVEWTVDGEIQDTLTLQGLEVGKNTIVRTYRDKAGNEGSDSIDVYMTNPKELTISVVEPVTIVNEDSVSKYYSVNPPEPGEAYAVSIYNPYEEKEVETIIGGTFGKKSGSNDEPYPGMGGGHLGPTLAFGLVTPSCGDNPAAGLCTLDDLVESDGLISLEAGGGWDRKKVTVDEYVEEYCTADFRKDYKKTGDMKKANLFDMKLKVKIWIYTNLGSVLDEYRFTQELNNADYADEAGQVQLFFELKPDISGDVTASNGRLLGTGAYIYKTEASTVAELRCQLPDEAIGHRRKVSDELLKPFGYKRPNTKSSGKKSSKKK